MTSWTVAHQAPQCMGFFRPGYWSGLPFHPPGDLPDPGTEPASPALAGGFSTTDLGSHRIVIKSLYFKPRVSGSKPKSTGDVAGTAKRHCLMYCTTVLFKILYCKLKIFPLFFVFVFYVLFV